jgi:hypothetical protein
VHGVLEKVLTFFWARFQELPGSLAALLYVARGASGYKITQ